MRCSDINLLVGQPILFGTCETKSKNRHKEEAKSQFFILDKNWTTIEPELEL